MDNIEKKLPRWDCFAPLKTLYLKNWRPSAAVVGAGQLDGVVGVEGPTLVGQLGLELRGQGQQGMVLNIDINIKWMFRKIFIFHISLQPIPLKGLRIAKMKNYIS